MRLFVAVVPPPDALAELAEAIMPVRALPGAERLRWTEAEGWHFTLVFLGEVEGRRLPELTERLGRAARRHAGHTLRLAGGGRFGDRTLWVGVGGERQTLAHLAGSASAAARRTGIDVEERPFHPHLTLARSRTLRRSGEGAASVGLRPFAEALAEFHGTAWQADSVRLMSSTPGGTGEPPHYDTVQLWTLGAG